MANLVPLKFKPGIVRDTTHYTNSGGWFDCDKVRFRLGLPEKIGGWQKSSPDQFLGTCRALLNWTTLNGAVYLGLGTSTKYYITDGGSFVDVTPLRRTITLGADPFASTDTETRVVVTDVANGSILGDYVTFSGATGFAGIPAGDLNKEHVITEIIDDDTYAIEVATAANATTSGGGAAVDAEYQINIGLDTTVYGVGWGTGTWGTGVWGISTGTGAQIGLRIWSHDTFGEDVIANVRNEGIYYWDATNPTDRMIALEDIPGANEAPVVATQIAVSAEERHVIAFGANPIGSATQDPLFVRWSDTEDAGEWEPLATNSAGGYRLSVGTFIVCAEETRSEILIWTDMALYSMRWTGGQFVFSFTQLATGTNIIGPNASAAINDVVFWMGKENFYFYDGRMKVLECPLIDYISERIDLQQSDKVFAFTNALFSEVGWLYQSIDGDECDEYVIYNYEENVWYYGTLSRTAWLDRGPSYYPLATSDDSYLYDQEFGLDDGSTNPPSAIHAYIQSSPMEMDAEGMGMHYMFLTRLIPDVTFRNSTETAPSVTMTIKMQDYPGGDYAQDNPSTITQGAVVPVEQFTRQAFIRLRGRSAVFRIESDREGVTWRLGVPRVEVRPDGRR